MSGSPSVAISQSRTARDPVVGADQHVVEPVVAVHDAPAGRAESAAPTAPSRACSSSAAGRSRLRDASSCFPQRLHLPVQEALGPAEVAEADRGGVDRVQLDQGVDQRSRSARVRSAPSGGELARPCGRRRPSTNSMT